MNLLLLKKMSQAGSLESGDVMVTISPRSEDVLIRLESPVEAMFGDAIRKEILDVVESLEVTGAKIEVVDKGALPYAVKARVETALRRAC